MPQLPASWCTPGNRSRSACRERPRTDRIRTSATRQANRVHNSRPQPPWLSSGSDRQPSMGLGYARVSTNTQDPQPHFDARTPARVARAYVDRVWEGCFIGRPKRSSHRIAMLSLAIGLHRVTCPALGGGWPLLRANRGTGGPGHQPRVPERVDRHHGPQRPTAPAISHLLGDLGLAARRQGRVGGRRCALPPSAAAPATAMYRDERAVIGMEATLWARRATIYGHIQGLETRQTARQAKTSAAKASRG